VVNYRYYEGSWFKLPDFSNIAPIKQGQTAGFLLTERNRDDFYAMQFSGKLIVPTSGSYTLYAKSDDGSRITIDEQVIVLNDGTHPAIEKQGVVTLSAGEHDIVVDFFEYAGGDSIEISWAGPGIAKQQIPVSALASGTIVTGSTDGGTTDGTTTGATTGTTAGTTDGTTTGVTAGTTDGTTTGTTDGGISGTAGVLNYQYFEGQWTKLPDFNQLTPVLEGQQSDFSLAAKQVSDNYGFRFAALVDVPNDGAYTFYLSSDDGSRLSIDGQLLIDNDGLHANREYNAVKTLTAGQHHVLVEFFELRGLDTLAVEWSAAGMPRQPLANASLESAPFNFSDVGTTTGAGTAGGTTDGTTGGTTASTSGDTTAGATDGGTTGGDSGQGINPPTTASDINYEYFEGNWTSLPNFDALTPLNTGTAPKFALPPSNGVKYYGYRFTGKIFIPQTGIYEFFSTSNDGSQLFIDDVLVVNNNGKHTAIEKQGAINLTAGLHDIRVTYFQSNGSEALEVEWSGPGVARQEINPNDLFKP